MKSVLRCKLQSVTNAILTELQTPSSFNIHVSISEKVKDEQRAKATRGSNVLTVSNTRWFCGKCKGNHTGSEKSGSSAYYANFTSVEDYDYDDDMNESANACQAHNNPVDPGSDDGEDALHYDDDEENDKFSSCVALDVVTLFAAADLDAIAPDLSAQLVQASAQAYLSFGKEKGKGKGQGKGRCPVRPSHLSLEDRRRRMKELKAKTECRACGRKGHWANDREYAMSSSSSSTKNQTRTARMATRQHLSNQANQVGACFVLNDYSGDPDTSAYMVGQNVPLPTEPTEQTPLTPTASVAVDIKKAGTFDAHATDDNDEPRASETDHKTGWNKEFKSGMYRGMLYGIVVRDYPEQVVSLAKGKSVPANMHEFLSLSH